MKATGRVHQHSPWNHEQCRPRLQKMACDVCPIWEAQRDLVVGPEQLGACSQIIFASKSPSVAFVQLSHWVFSVFCELHSWAFCFVSFPLKLSFQCSDWTDLVLWASCASHSCSSCEQHLFNNGQVAPHPRIHCVAGSGVKIYLQWT